MIKLEVNNKKLGFHKNWEKRIEVISKIKNKQQIKLTLKLKNLLTHLKRINKDTKFRIIKA